jgi:hypothetical protein
MQEILHSSDCFAQLLVVVMSIDRPPLLRVKLCLILESFVGLQRFRAMAFAEAKKGTSNGVFHSFFTPAFLFLLLPGVNMM